MMSPRPIAPKGPEQTTPGQPPGGLLPLPLELGDGRAQVRLDLCAHLLLAVEGLADVRLPLAHEAEEVGLPPLHRAAVDVVEIALDAGEEAHDLVGGAQRLILGLLEQLDHAITSVELALRGLVELGPELGEGLQLSER